MLTFKQVEKVAWVYPNVVDAFAPYGIKLHDTPHQGLQIPVVALGSGDDYLPLTSKEGFNGGFGSDNSYEPPDFTGIEWLRICLTIGFVKGELYLGIYIELPQDTEDGYIGHEVDGPVNEPYDVIKLIDEVMLNLRKEPVTWQVSVEGNPHEDNEVEEDNAFHETVTVSARNHVEAWAKACEINDSFDEDALAGNELRDDGSICWSRGAPREEEFFYTASFTLDKA